MIRVMMPTATPRSISRREMCIRDRGHAGGAIDQTQYPAEFDIPASHTAAAGRHSSGQRNAEAQQRTHQSLGHNGPDENGRPVILQNEADLDQRGQRGQGDKKDERPVGHPPV